MKTVTIQTISIIKIILLLLIFALVFSLLAPSKASALSGADFNPGRIIDDAVFYDSGSMSASQIQTFLDSKVLECDTDGSEPYGGTTRADYGTSRGYPPPYTCLKDYTQTVPAVTNGASDLCKNSMTGGTKTAAQIIHDVSIACGISPKVLIVLLEKEQSLVTDEWPWSIQYRSATGYGCPDTAPCDSEYYGFYNQVYQAAKAFRRYEANPGSFNYRPGRNNTILWHPNSACGTSTVYIENQATANLYIYTPYRPNQAALNNLYGTGDSCSSYGNRNFWRIFNDWFGSSTIVNNVRLIQCGDNQYLVERFIKRKRLITSTGLTTWGLENKFFSVEDPGCNYPAYDLPLERLIRSRTTGKLYMVDLNVAYLVTDQSVANAWNLGDISQTVPQFEGKSINDNLNVIYNLPQLVTSDNVDRADYYIIDSAKRYTVAGTPVNDTASLQLIEGYGKMPRAVMSAPLLQTLPHSGSIDYAFSSDTVWYLLDHYKLKKVDPSVVSRWQGALTGPTLSKDFLRLFPEKSVISSLYEKDGVVSRVSADGVALLKTSPSDSTKVLESYWTNETVPTITRLLRNKLEGKFTVQTVNPVEGNFRLIECGSQKFAIERYIKRKRALSQEGLDSWNLTAYTFFPEDRGCDYPTYSLTTDRLVRSRTTNKLYYVDKGTAYYVHSQEVADEWGFGDINATHPMKDGKSINDYLVVKQQLPHPEEM